MAELCFRQELRESFGASVFRKTERLAKKSGLTKHLDSLAEKQGYRGGMDWLLCYMRPEFKELVFNYYLGRNGRFDVMFPHLTKPIDRVMAKALTDAGFCV